PHHLPVGLDRSQKAGQSDEPTCPKNRDSVRGDHVSPGAGGGTSASTRRRLRIPPSFSDLCSFVLRSISGALVQKGPRPPFGRETLRLIRVVYMHVIGGPR